MIQFFKIVLTNIPPVIVGFDDTLQGQACLVLVEQHLDQHVVVLWTLAIEDELDIASHGEDAVVGPFATFQRPQVVSGKAIAVEVEETYQRHDDDLVAIA